MSKVTCNKFYEKKIAMSRRGSGVADVMDRECSAITYSDLFFNRIFRRVYGEVGEVTEAGYQLESTTDER